MQLPLRAVAAKENICCAPPPPPPPPPVPWHLFAARSLDLLSIPASCGRRQLAAASARTSRECDRLRSNHLWPSWKSVKIGERSIENSFWILSQDTFLVACTRLYKTLCRSVGPSVGPSVCLHLVFNRVFLCFEACRICYCPCPTARDWCSRVSGLV